MFSRGIGSNPLDKVKIRLYNISQAYIVGLIGRAAGLEVCDPGGFFHVLKTVRTEVIGFVTALNRDSQVV
jgi:hypothetical protein